MSGRFITVEGIEGVGKSTHLAAIEQFLQQAGKRVTMTREPGGTPVGEALRGVLLDPKYQGMNSEAELLLMFAARAEHLAKVIKPQREAGAWVVCDRFTDATFAYQGGGRGIPSARIAALEAWVQQGFQPDATLLLDAPVEVGLARARGRGPADRFEQEQASFFERVRAVYLERAWEAPGRFHIIDAAQPLAAVEAQVRQTLEKLVRDWDSR